MRWRGATILRWMELPALSFGTSQTLLILWLQHVPGHLFYFLSLIRFQLLTSLLLFPAHHPFLLLRALWFSCGQLPSALWVLCFGLGSRDDSRDGFRDGPCSVPNTYSKCVSRSLFNGNWIVSLHIMMTWDRLEWLKQSIYFQAEFLTKRKLNKQTKNTNSYLSRSKYDDTCFWQD